MLIAGMSGRVNIKWFKSCQSLSNYLIVCLLVPAQVKKVPGHLLLCLLLLSLLAASPELAIRSTLSLAGPGNHTVCILTTSTTTQALVNTLRLLVRNLLPVFLVIRAASSHCSLLGGRFAQPQERSVSSCNLQHLTDIESFQAGYSAGYLSWSDAGGKQADIRGKTFSSNLWRSHQENLQASVDDNIPDYLHFLLVSWYPVPGTATKW